MRAANEKRLGFAALFTGVGLGLCLAGVVLWYGRQLRDDIRQKMIERSAAVLYPVAQQQIETEDRLEALLPDAHREGVLAMAVFDGSGVVVERIPSAQLAELSLQDLVELQNGRPISHFDRTFRLANLFPDAAASQTSPVLEILLPLHRRGYPSEPFGFVRYHMDARQLAGELAMLDSSVQRKTLMSLTVGCGMIGLFVCGAYVALVRSQRAVAEGNVRLARTQFELSFAAKASVVGQITSHLLHGLKGSMSGLESVIQSGDQKAAVAYTERLRSLIQETVDLLGDHAADVTYELSGEEIAELVRQRHANAAKEAGVALTVSNALQGTLDSHRGSLLCLIAGNLVQNALFAAGAGGWVRVAISAQVCGIVITVADNGPGIPDSVRLHLFTPGVTGRTGGTGLGLAISALLAKQIGASLELIETGAAGTVFRIALPRSTADMPVR
jgi:signal transduction histidine kinase